MHESTSGCASLGAQMVKNLPAMQETVVQPLSQGDPLEKGLAIHSNILAWRIPWTEEPGGLTGHGVPKSWTQLSKFHFLRHPRSRALRGADDLMGKCAS